MQMPIVRQLVGPFCLSHHKLCRPLDHDSGNAEPQIAGALNLQLSRDKWIRCFEGSAKLYQACISQRTSMLSIMLCY